MRLGLRKDKDLPENVEDDTPGVWSEPDEALLGDEDRDTETEHEGSSSYIDRLTQGALGE